MTPEQHRQTLLEHLERKQLALFIGADLPLDVTGLPSRADLARDLAQRKDLDESLSLAQVAQRVGRAGSRWDFTDFIRSQLDTAGKSPQAFHRQIVGLVQAHRVETLITTAYDDLLERAFQEASLGLNRVVRGSDVSFVKRGRPTLIKLYGDATQPDTLIVTEDDHFGLWRDRDREDLLDEVRSALRRNVVLFLGYNLSDPDFNLLWREVLDRAGRFAMGAYAVWPGLAEGEVQMWRDRGVTILEYDPLDLLGEAAAQTAPPAQPEATVPAPAGAEGAAWDTGAIRQLLTAALDDEGLTTLCFDHFRVVYEDFSSGMSKGDKVQKLLDYCVRHEQTEALLEQIKQRNPTQYGHFASRLRG